MSEVNNHGALVGKQYAPIVLFVYNRLAHTQRTIEALQKNILATQSDLIIFSDAAKNETDAVEVQEVREYICTVTGFRTIRVEERDENLGLAESIISGVSQVISQYGRVIVLEDDLVTSPAFLSFMNHALDRYQTQGKVWHISGWNYPIDNDGLEDTFFWRAMNCWGWATWADRWACFEKSPHRLVSNWSKSEKKSFDLENCGVFWPQVVANADGRIDTWAIFWYATIFERNGLCLNPSVSYVNNIGHDGSGVHCGKDKSHQVALLNNKDQVEFSTDYRECDLAVDRIVEFYKRQNKKLYIRLVNKIARVCLGKNLFK